MAEDDLAPFVISSEFEEAFINHVSHLQEPILALLERIAENPYEPDLVLRCRIDPENESFAYLSPAGFELYWDVEVEPSSSAFPKAMRVLLLELRVLSHKASDWLCYPQY